MSALTQRLRSDWTGYGVMVNFAKCFNEVVRRVNCVDCQPSGTGYFDESGLHLDGVGGGGGLVVYGDPVLYKGIFLRGWVKADAVTDWAAMTVVQETATPPTRLATSFVDGVDAYPWYGLRPTWDWPRAHG